MEVIGGEYQGNYTYYFANGERVAWKGPDGSMHYIHGDHLGSTVMVTDENGNVEEETTYYPYGGIRSGGNLTRYLYTGQEYIKELGLYNYQGREYKPGIPGFIEPDPIIPDVYDPQTFNRYSYVRNNPVKYTDPEGNILFVPFVLMVGVGVLFECNYLSSTPNPTLEGTVTEGVIGTSATAAGLATGGAAVAAGAGAATTGAVAAGSMQLSENVMRGDDATEGVAKAAIFGAVAGKAVQVAGTVAGKGLSKIGVKSAGSPKGALKTSSYLDDAGKGSYQGDVASYKKGMDFGEGYKLKMSKDTAVLIPKEQLGEGTSMSIHYHMSPESKGVIDFHNPDISRPYRFYLESLSKNPPKK